MRIAKYLLGRKRYVLKFGYQKQVYALNCFGDSDFAGEIETRKSTSGGLMCLGDHAIKTWSSTQSVIALSTGEAEMYAINKTAASGMGGNSILHDLGVNLDLRVFTDATTGKSLVTRRGLGKVRHMRSMSCGFKAMFKQNQSQLSRSRTSSTHRISSQNI